MLARRKIIPLLISGIVLGCLAMSSAVFASDYESDGEDTASSTSKCTTAVSKVTWCGHYGVSWRYYKVNSNANANAKSRCSAIGAKGYFVLAYEKVKKGSSASSWSFVGEQAFNPGVQVHQVKPTYAGGSGSYNVIESLAGTEKWNDVKAQHDKAKELNLIGPDDAAWGNTTWFCSDYTDETKGKGYVTANSGVSVNGVSGSKTGADVGPDSTGFGKNNVMTITVETSNSSVSGNMWHNQYYQNEDSSWDETKKRWSDRSFRLDLWYDIADGDVDACGGRDLCSTDWEIEPWKKKKEHTNVGNKPYTLQLDNVGSTATKCQTMTIEPLRFVFTSADGGDIVKETGRAHTSVCVVAKRIDKPAEPKDEFWATSSVQVPNASAQLGGYDPGKQTSDKDAAVGLKVSTDSDSLQFTLSHNMDFDWTDWTRNMWRYWDGCISTNADGSCNGDWVYVGSQTNLSYELTGDTGGVVENNNDEDATYKAGTDKDTDNGGEEVSTHTYTISGMEAGKTYKVCHKIKYSPKTYTTPITESLIWTGPWSIGPRWDYGTPQANNDSEDSEACIEITRPADPPEGGDPDPYGPKNGGDSASDIMYAGEHTGIGWKVAAKSVPTRRVKDYSAIGFVVRDDVTGASVVNAGGHVSSDPCNYFRTKSGGRLISFGGANCAEFSGDGLSIEENADGIAGKATQLVPTPNNSEQDAFTQQLDIAVPDNVGGKYCNSYGYKWGYWWGVAKASDASGLTDDVATWTYVPGKDYWTNYSATCRTIAKKPSFAVWNGSLFSGAGVSSSTAPRHNEANNGQPTKLNNDSEKTTYGSWAENIVAAQGEVSRFASSGAYGAGIPGLVSGNQWDMAWQTITNIGLVANGTTLGNSGINYNSSYSTRLSAYLKSHATNADQEEKSYDGAVGVGDTRILYFNPGGENGTLTISSNVELANTSGKTIYEMPQVVIYVDGNVEIAPSVTRLDAWIIANGNINTCSDWVEKTTETQSVYRNQNTTCDNRLQINGPVVAKSVTLNRTYGADNLAYGISSFKNTSSEVFNLSALSYLWSFAQAGRYDSSYTDAYARELAPRY